jgi:transposase
LIQKLQEENRELKEQIRLLTNGRKSHTSHTPPSQDLGRANKKNSREVSGKPSGGQKGHQGSTLEMKKIADEFIEHKPIYCTNCSSDLLDAPSTLDSIKQEVVIPEFKAKFIEHQSFSRVCNICGFQNKAKLPIRLAAPVQYGESVNAAVTYLSIYQYLPYNRIKKLMNDLFQLQISEGTINNILVKMTQRSLPVYKQIQQRLLTSSVVGGDETGTRINKDKGWFHVWQNPSLTFIVASLSRGYSTAEDHFSNGFTKAVYVSDCWSSQLKVPALKHQLCLAHLLRELTNFEDAFSCQWSSKMKSVMKRAIGLKNEMTLEQYLKPPEQISEIEKELDELLQIDINPFHKKQQAFIKRLRKNRQSILVFLYHKDVPFDNNASERAIRNVKVKNKISGCFRSFKGANNFAILRSVIDTTIKNTKDVWESIQLIAKVVPEL